LLAVIWKYQFKNNLLLLFLLTILNMLPYRNPLRSLDNILSKVH